ncbi:Mitochondrial thiamine pyrophosphate carrier [Stylophora pistillata]|uniref:Mitochondrial thiamine pyrophosphate carrier n=1 Tax=Stylophora pistillata TaxID=50429 RepID=A0A2B4SMM6_STYPI|nr:Mitochondrial thiamine pyrophosphate carrier [Stylophora pistillata]
MVGFDPGRKEKKISSTQCGVCGSVSGLVTRLVVQPFDVLKIRFQLQIEPTSKKIATGKYSGIWQAFKLIYKEEGFTSLWKGHVPAQVLSVVYGYFQFTAFEAITEVMWRVNPRCTDQKWKPGLAPTLVQIFPHAGLQFGFYSFFKTLWEISFRIKRQDPYKAAGVDESLVCGAIAGFFSKGVIYPLDMVKKRLQVQGFQDAREIFGRVQKYNGMLDCFRIILREEGAFGFFKGLAPSTLKDLKTLEFRLGSLKISAKSLKISADESKSKFSFVSGVESAGLSVAIIFCTYEQCIVLVREYLHDDNTPELTR